MTDEDEREDEEPGPEYDDNPDDDAMWEMILKARLRRAILEAEPKPPAESTEA